MAVDEDRFQMYTVGEVAGKLRVTRDTIRALIRSGQLAALRNGSAGRYRITHQALAEYIAASYRPAGGDEETAA